MESVKPILIACWVKYAGKLINNNVLRHLCYLYIKADQDAHGLPDGSQDILQDNCPAVTNADQNDFNWVVLVIIVKMIWMVSVSITKRDSFSFCCDVYQKDSGKLKSQ